MYKRQEWEHGGVWVFQIEMWQRRLPLKIWEIILKSTIPGKSLAWLTNGQVNVSLFFVSFFPGHVAEQIKAFDHQELCDSMPRTVLTLRNMRFGRYPSPSPWRCLFHAVPINTWVPKLYPSLRSSPFSTLLFVCVWHCLRIRTSDFSRTFVKRLKKNAMFIWKLNKP